MYDPDQESARSLVFAALIVQSVLTVIFLISIASALFASIGFSTTTVTGPGGTTTTTTPVATGFPIILGTVFGIFFLIAILWIVLDYFLIYRKIKDGRIDETESTSMVLGILQLLFGGLVAGILLLVAHGRIVNSVRYRRNNPADDFMN